MRKGIRKIVNIAFTVLLSLVLLLFGGVGCFDSCDFSLGDDGEYEFSFKSEDISLVKGEEYTFKTSDFSFAPQAPVAFLYTLTSSDTEVVSVNGNKIKGLKEGKVTLTALADGKSATCSVSVTNEIESVKLMTRTRSRALSENREIDVYAIINNDSKVTRSVEWEIDGVKSDFTGSVYTLAPSQTAKTVEVKATVLDSEGNEYLDTLTVNWYEDFIVAPVLLLKSGETAQTKGETTPVTYEIACETTAQPIIEWLVNGKSQQEEGNEFTLPAQVEAGEYRITALVNGTEATVPSGKNKVSVVGAKVPTGLTVDYDSLYPSVLVKWDEASANETFTLSATNELGQEKTFTATGNDYIIDGEEISVIEHSYTFKVKSNGDGNALTSSEYGETVAVAKVDASAKQYLEKKWFGGNYYITSDLEFYQIYDYFMLYREQPVNYSTQAEYTVYMGYTTHYTLDRLSTIAFNRSGYTGEYEIDAQQSGKTVKLTFVFKTLSQPTRRNTSVSAKQLNGITPHISETGREKNHTLYIETLQKSAEVHTTDQMYRVAELGYKPVITNNDNLKSYYGYAKNVLNAILDEEMTDVEKAHAIYDWVMWRVLYDSGVVGITELSEAVKYAPFYIEGVFSDKYYFAVCDGMSKAYSLLCNMEGIPCVRITGQAMGESSSGGHAWNKVFVDGGWYIVDCTWGDTQIAITETKSSLFGSVKNTETNELASHHYFLKTDGEMSTHVEDEDTNYPATSALPYNIYAEIEYKYSADKTLVPYLYQASDLTAYSNAIATLASEELSGGNRSFVVKGTTTTTAFFAMEVYIAPTINATVQSILLSNKPNDTNPIKTALTQKGLKYNLFLEGNRLIVVTSKTRALI